MAKTRNYIVTDAQGAERLIEATSAPAAMKYAVQSTMKVRIASVPDTIRLMQSGVHHELARSGLSDSEPFSDSGDDAGDDPNAAPQA